MALSRQSAPPAAPDGRACNGAAAEDTGRARNPRPPEKVQALRRGDSGLVRCPRRRRPQRAASGLSLLRRPTSGAHATAIGRCGPFLLWAGIWKRFHMFTTDDPELARSPGRWLELTRGPATVRPSQRRRAVIPDLEMAKATAASVGPEPRQQRVQREKPCRPEQIRSKASRGRFRRRDSHAHNPETER